MNRWQPNTHTPSVKQSQFKNFFLDQAKNMKVDLHLQLKPFKLNRKNHY